MPRRRGVERGPGVRQQRRERRPVLPVPRLVRQGRLHQCAGRRPPGSAVHFGQLVQGHRLDQPVHRHRSRHGRADQGELAQLRRRVEGGEGIGQQRGDGAGRIGSAGTVGSGGRVARRQQQAHRDVVGRVAGEQPQQRDRVRRGGRELLEGQRPGRCHRSAEGGRPAAAQDLGPMVAQQPEVLAQGQPGCRDVPDGLPERQRQRAELVGEQRRGTEVLVAGAVDQVLGGRVPVEGGHPQAFGLRPDRRA